jgi:hypothetical protein
MDSLHQTQHLAQKKPPLRQQPAHQKEMFSAIQLRTPYANLPKPLVQT